MTREFRKDIRGRGASSNTTSRYDHFKYEPTEEDFDNYSEEKSILKTEVFKDSSRTIVSENSSPDVGLRFTVNAYRGCEHGCAYCYARPTHEYLGYSAGLDFESKIFIKEKAPELLRETLMKRSWKPEVVAMSGITDCYQPLERKFELTRGCLKVLAEFKNPVSMITKNHLIVRDLDIFTEMLKYNGILIYISVTTLDGELAQALEPRTSHPLSRLKAIETLSKAGIPVGVNVAPCIPGLTDHEMPNILKAASEAGAKFAGYVPVRLPSSVAPLFQEWLEVHRPLKAQKVLNSIRDLRGGSLNDPRFGSRMRGEGPRADQMEQLFKLYSRKYNFNQETVNLSIEHFKRPSAQLEFDLE